MGITVTTNLSLIKPDADESIKENLPTFAGWADQNADNCDVLDALFRAETLTWTPTWTADTTSPTLGAGGFIEGKYIRLTPRMTYGYFRIFTGGAGFAAGSGTYHISAPPAVVPSEFTTFFNNVVIGKVALFDNDTVLTSSNMIMLYDVASTNFYFRSSTGSTWNPTTPITLAQNDRLAGYFMYPTSVA